MLNIIHLRRSWIAIFSVIGTIIDLITSPMYSSKSLSISALRRFQLAFMTLIERMKLTRYSTTAYQNVN